MAQLPEATRGEPDLIARAVAGDQGALEDLLLAHSRRLALHINQRMPKHLQGLVDANDVAQETFVDVFQRITAFKPQAGATFFAWLATIAEHRLLDILRAKQAAKRGGDRQAVDADATCLIGLLEQVAISTRTPSRSAAGHEAVAAVQAALALLPEDYRAALQLRHIEGLPAAEAAVRMQRTERAVHMLCHRALKQLLAVMGPESQFLTRSA